MVWGGFLLPTRPTIAFRGFLPQTQIRHSSTKGAGGAMGQQTDSLINPWVLLQIALGTYMLLIIQTTGYKSLIQTACFSANGGQPVLQMVSLADHMVLRLITQVIFTSSSTTTTGYRSLTAPESF